MTAQLIKQPNYCSSFNVPRGGLGDCGYPSENFSVKSFTSKYLPSFIRLWSRDSRISSSPKTSESESFETANSTCAESVNADQLDTPDADLLQDRRCYKSEETSVIVDLPLNNSNSSVGGISVNDKLIALDVSNCKIEETRDCNVLLYDRLHLNFLNALSVKGVIKQIFLPNKGNSVVIYCKQNKRNTVIAWDWETNTVHTLVLDECNEEKYRHDYFFRESNLIVYMKRKNGSIGHSAVVYKINENENEKYFELWKNDELNEGYFFKHIPSSAGLEFFGIFGYSQQLGTLCSAQIRSKGDFTLLRTITFSAMSSKITYADQHVRNVFILNDRLIMSVNAKKECIVVGTLDQDQRPVHRFHITTFHNASDSCWFNWGNVTDVAVQYDRVIAVDGCGCVAIWDLPLYLLEKSFYVRDADPARKVEYLPSTSYPFVILADSYRRKITFAEGPTGSAGHAQPVPSRGPAQYRDVYYQYQFDFKLKKIIQNRFSKF